MMCIAALCSSCSRSEKQAARSEVGLRVGAWFGDLRVGAALHGAFWLERWLRLS